MSLSDTELNVKEGFDLLIEALEEEKKGVNDIGSDAFKRDDLLTVDDMRQQAGAINALRDKVLALRTEWQSIMPSQADISPAVDEQKEPKRDLGRVLKGERTHDREYELPILNALVKCGGKAPTAKVIDIVGTLMKDILVAIDYQPLPSNKKEIRWQNTAHWVRQKLVDEGDMKPKEQRGMWEISEQGRRRVEASRKK